MEQHSSIPTIAFALIELALTHSIIRTVRLVSYLMHFVEPHFWTSRYLSDVVRLSIGILSYILNFSFSPPPPSLRRRENHRVSLEGWVTWEVGVHFGNIVVLKVGCAGGRGSF